MKPSLNALIVFLLLAVPAFAEDSVPVNVPKAGDYLTWVAYQGADGNSSETAPVAFSGKSGHLGLPEGKSAGLRALVLDQASGNLAMLPFNNSAKPLAIKKADFGYLRLVRLHIVSDGKSVSTARVTLSGGKGFSQTRILDPTMDGMADFQNVPGGKGTVMVRYNGSRSASQDIDLPLVRKSPVLSVDIPIVGAKTVSTKKSASKSASNSKQEEEPRSSAAAGPMNGLLGLIFVALVLCAGYVVLREKGILEQLKNAMAGVHEEEEPQLAPEPAPRDDSICPFCGQKKDASGACACSLSAAPVVGLPSGGAKIVGIGGSALGQVFPLAGGVSIGREPGNTVVLAGDSTVSRKHARIAAENGGFRLFDEGSANGTFVNGARVTDQTLSPGDEIRIGGSLFRMEG